MEQGWPDGPRDPYTQHQVTVAIRRLPSGEGLDYPSYMSAGAAGCDLAAAVTSTVELAPGERALLPTGFAVALPPGFEAQIRPRSGLALRHGLTTLNSPGTIDSDYRGEVHVLLVNLGQERVRIERGERIAQMVVAPVARAVWRPVAELPETGRGAGGFGHTGR